MPYGFEPSDLEVTMQELAALPLEQQRWVQLSCEMQNEFTFLVGSQTGPEKYEVMHDDISIVSCTCTYARLRRRPCKAHFFRAAYALRKRNVRLAQTVVRPEPKRDRLSGYLTRDPTFHFYR